MRKSRAHASLPPHLHLAGTSGVVAESDPPRPELRTNHAAVLLLPLLEPTTVDGDCQIDRLQTKKMVSSSVIMGASDMQIGLGLCRLLVMIRYLYS